MDVAHPTKKMLNRQLDSVVLHFDYDCFYASVFEAETPALRSLPLAVQQKQIVVTCNYEARRRGLHKLQLISEAKKICPDAVIVLGEDLTRFRNASKDLYAFFRAFSWNSKVERLGFDEVYMDVTDMVDYNVGLLNTDNLGSSFFQLSKTDPTVGFAYDASQVAGHACPEASPTRLSRDASWEPLRLRLHLGSHLARHLRTLLHAEKGFTCTVGISTNKLLAKLVGNVHKPNNQTTLLPPYISETSEPDNVTAFVDAHELRKIPGIGFRLAQKLRDYILDRPSEPHGGTEYEEIKEKVSVGAVRSYPGMSALTLERVLGGHGTPYGIGAKVWGLLNGIDDSGVREARDVPKQISIEDSYRRLDSLEDVIKQLQVLSHKLLRQMHMDLLEDEEDDAGQTILTSRESQIGVEVMDCPPQRNKRWVAFPKTIRLSTRPRCAPKADGSRYRSFNRISRSTPMPNFALSLKHSTGSIVDRLVKETLIPLFRQLHPEKNGWDLSLINIAATNIVDAANDTKSGVGRDISKMFKRQEEVHTPWRTISEEVTETSGPVEMDEENKVEDSHMTGLTLGSGTRGSEDMPTPSQESHTRGDPVWEDDEGDSMDEIFHCDLCDAAMPLFAMAAHARWHESG